MEKEWKRTQRSERSFEKIGCSTLAFWTSQLNKLLGKVNCGAKGRNKSAYIKVILKTILCCQTSDKKENYFIVHLIVYKHG